MKSSFRRRLSPLTYGVMTVGFLLLIWVSYLLLPILMPFVIALLLTYIFHPIQNWLVSRHVSRNLAAVSVMFIIFLVGLVFFLVLLPMLFEQFLAFYNELTLFFDKSQISWIHAQEPKMGLLPNLIDNVIEWAKLNTDRIQDVLPDILSRIGTGGVAIVQDIAMILLLPVIFFYFLRDADLFAKRLTELSPRRYLPFISSLTKEMDSVLGEFLRGELMVMLTMSVIYTSGLWLVGLNTALPVGVISGVLTFIPYVGAAAGLLLGMLSAFAQTGNLLDIFPTLLVFLSGQALESNIVTPKLVGRRIGLHPLAVIFALLAFGKLFGFLGVLLALPIAALMQVGIKRLLMAWKQSDYYQRQPRRPL